MRNRRKYLIFGIAVAVVVLAAVLGILANKYYFSREAKEGRNEMKELQEKADEENFQFQISPDWVFETGEAKGELFIANPIENPYKTQVKVVLEEDEREVYRTDILMPGERIRNDALLEPLPKGTYDATAYFMILNLETEESVGKVAAAVTIEVQK